MIGEPQGAGPIPAGVFATTHWSVIVCAGETESPLAAEALSRLCGVYWYPLYAYVRRQGHDPHEAQDLTQEFFARLLAKNFLRSLDRQKGKFRSFLLAAMEHFLAKEWRDSRRLKRGGGQTMISLDDQDAESRYLIEPVETMTAEKIYERRWAFTLLEQAIHRLREEFEAAGKRPLFDGLSGFLSGERTGSSYAEAGLKLDMTEGAVKVAVHRLRQRYGELVRMEIANTVSAPDEVDDELRHLMTALGGG
jgi:RNA polymerase sigma-70 factor (ECF subfamily)